MSHFHLPAFVAEIRLDELYCFRLATCKAFMPLNGRHIPFGVREAQTILEVNRRCAANTSQVRHFAQRFPVNSAQEIIERHIELEVMLRLRTLEAAKAKIHWAEAMRQAIVDGLSQRKCESGGVRVIGPLLICWLVLV